MAKQEQTYREYVNGFERMIWKDLPFDCTIGQCGAMIRPSSDVLESNPSAPLIPCPGYPRSDRRNHGIGSARYRYVIRGEGLAVQFVYSLGGPDQYLPETAQRLMEYCEFHEPMAWDLGWHSIFDPYEPSETMDDNGEKVYESWTYKSDECYILGVPCFYDGSSFNADPYLKALLEEGEDKVWEMLEEYFKETMQWMSEAIKKQN